MPRGEHFKEMNKIRNVAEFDNTLVRDLSESVYRDRLGPADVLAMIEKDKDQGQKLRNRSDSYDVLTRCYLRAIKEKGLLK